MRVVILVILTLVFAVIGVAIAIPTVIKTKTSMTSVESDIQTLKTGVTTLDTEVKTLESSVVNNNSEIAQRLYNNNVMIAGTYTFTETTTLTLAIEEYAHNGVIIWGSTNNTEHCLSTNAGVTFTQTTPAQFSTLGHIVSYGQNLWLAVAKNGTQTTTSTDGATWTTPVSRTFGADNTNKGFVLYSKIANKFLIDYGAYYSSDGSTFTANVGQPVLRLLAENNTICVCATTTGLQTTVDGLTWSATSGGPGTVPRALVWNPLVATFYCFMLTIEIYTSPDGINWTLSTNTIPTGILVYGGVWSEKLGCIAMPGSGTDVMYTFDGSVWRNSNQTSSSFALIHNAIVATNTTIVVGPQISGSVAQSYIRI